MKLAALYVKNYKGIGDIESGIRIDKIVVLIGPNNAGKSTLLDAYEAFASSGSAMDLSHFHREDPTKPITITGIFTDLSDDDNKTIGKEWQYDDPEYGLCIKYRWVWVKDGQRGQKYAFNAKNNEYVSGGLGGFDSLVASRIPQPIRIKPTDSISATQEKVVAILKDHVKKRLKDDSSRTKIAFEALEKLAAELFEESRQTFEDLSSRITSSIDMVFPGLSIELIVRSKDAFDEKLIGANSYLKVSTNKEFGTPLVLQGTGLQRALLWSALSVMSDVDAKKKVRSTEEPGKILLIDEPEAFLHPPTIRTARESLYDFALNNEDWQVIATSHSPIFIDLAKLHTTIVRVEPAKSKNRFVSTNKLGFEADARQRLQMLRACNSMVNEFFFYDNIVLVEGPTEVLAMKHVAEELQIDVHIIDCMGKANIPIFAAILNQFQVPYLVIHDSDTPKCKRKGIIVGNGMWKVNSTIRNVVQSNQHGRLFTQFENFEAEFLDPGVTRGKVDNVQEVLRDSTRTDYRKLFDQYKRLLQKDETLMTTTVDAFEAKQSAYIKTVKPEDLWQWDVDA